jgi:hypothetical protein
MSVRTGARWLLTLFLLCLMAGCAFLVRPGEGFEKASHDFAQRLRWQDYNGAGRYLTGQNREAFLKRFAALTDLHIVDVTVERAELGPEPDRGTTWMVLEYYLLPSPAVKKFHLQLHWVRLGGGEIHPGTWRITSAFPDFP